MNASGSPIGVAGQACASGDRVSSSPAAKSRRWPIWVWLILAVVAVWLVIGGILALVAISTIGVKNRRANEFSAINSIRMINQAELEYRVTYPAKGYACPLQTLGGDPASGPPSASSAQILPPDRTARANSGYIFAIGNCTRVTINGEDRYTGYTITAVPQNVGKSGNRGFCGDEAGEIKADPAGGTNCTETVQ